MGEPGIGSVTIRLGAGTMTVVQGTAVRIPLALSGSQVWNIGAPGGDGVAQITVPADMAVIDPIFVPGIGDVCVDFPVDGIGFIDCDGGRPGLDITVQQDHNTAPGNTGNSGSAMGLPDDPECDDMSSGPPAPLNIPSTAAADDNAAHPGACNSPVVVTLGGDPFEAGDVIVKATQTLTILGTGNRGPDNLPCTPDDNVPTPPTPTSLLLTTGTVRVTMFDANRTAGRQISPTVNCGLTPCTAQQSGAPFNCNQLRNGIATGGRIAGGFPAADSAIGDVVTTFVFVAE
jgi:hypothetical protein